MSEDQAVYVVDVTHFLDDNIWSGISDDIPGLCLETESKTAMIEAIRDCAPEMLAFNLKLSTDEINRAIIEVRIREVANEESEGPELHIAYV